MAAIISIRFIRLVFLCIITVVNSQKQEGDICTDDYTNSVGRCIKAEACQSAQVNFQQNGIRPSFCSYTFEGALVCCRDGGNILQVPTPTRQTTESRPVWGNSNAGQADNRRVCERKCEEYSRGVVQSVDFIPLLPQPEGMSISSSKCEYVGLQLIVGGEKAGLGEFPHMAAVGWADPEAQGGYTFKCGGSLISPNFVLTAGHCTRDPRSQNPVPVIVRLGDQNIDQSVFDGAEPVEVAIKNIHRHPEYKPPLKYNDIALLELATDVEFEARIRPACLWTESGTGVHVKAIATGWGVTDAKTRVTSKELLKVSLSLLDNAHCNQLLEGSQNRNWAGFSESQLCAGELRGGKDTCQGDSGSPLQVASVDNQCIFRVLGIVAFGRKCAESGTPSVYTRVSSYLDWIESIVWPGE